MNNNKFFIYTAIVCMCLGISINLQAQSFELISSSIANISYASVDVADYDNDKDDDILVQGAIDSDNDGYADKSVLYVYRNDNGSFVNIEDNDLYGTHLGAVMFIDIDNDMDMDIISTGQSYDDITKHYLNIYENIDGDFSLKEELKGGIYSSIDVGDIDNDGDLDFIIAGIAIVPDGTEEFFRIYKNDGGSFSLVPNTISTVQHASVKLADIDNDADLDIVLMGTTNDASENIIQTYINTDAAFALKQDFERGLYDGYLDIADYDNDGDLDMAALGLDPDYVSKTFIFKNEGGVYTKTDSLYGLNSSSATNAIAWGDYNNDGQVDLIGAGADEDYNDTTMLYKNTNGNMELVEEGLLQVGGGTTLAWIDIDKDNDLDLFLSGFRYEGEDYVTRTVLQKNITTSQNNAPNAPLNLQLSHSNNNYTFSWEANTDDHTPKAGLYYWLTVGSTENSSDIASYKVHGTQWTIKNISSDKIYWSVQAIDGSRVKSAKANNNNLGIEDTKTHSFALAPNPCHNMISVSSYTAANIQHIGIYNINSQLVKSISYANTVAVDIQVADLPAGIYLIQIETTKGIYNMKMIKE